MSGAMQTAFIFFVIPAVMSQHSGLVNFVYFVISKSSKKSFEGGFFGAFRVAAIHKILTFAVQKNSGSVEDRIVIDFVNEMFESNSWRTGVE